MKDWVIVAARSSRLLAFVVSGSLLAGASGCASKESSPVAVAQVAVRANPDLELLATDEQQGVLTVRLKRSNRVVTVRADAVVAGTAFRDVDMSAAPPAAAAAAPQPEPAPAASDAAHAAAAAPLTAPPAATAAARPSAAPPVQPQARTRPAPASSPAAEAQPPARGAEPPAPTAVAPAPPPQTQARTAGEGANIDESKLKRRTDPVQCRGVELVKLDGVLLEADRVAVEALGQCRVQITNSKIVGRVALMTAGNATATVENSIIEGGVAIQVTGTSSSAVRSSTIRGRVQKLQSGAVRDLGQNLWR